MGMESSAAPDDMVEIAKRFESIVEASSQAEIARKTETPTTSISRYVAGGKIPASFCAKLVRNLGVNPAWLLVGEGAPHLADVTGNTQSMAGNMLELVKAMNTVAGMRLGELVGKDHLKVLRQLNDALGRYDELKSELNQQSANVMTELMGKLKLALEQNQGRLAARYLEACKQMARLRDDPATAVELTRLEGVYTNRYVSSAKSLEFFKQVFVARLGESSQIGEEYCESVRDYTTALSAVCRYDEALRTCESALALIKGRKDLERWVSYLNVAAANFQVELGELRGAAARTSRYFPMVHEQDREAALYQYSYMQLYSGAWSLRRGPELAPTMRAVSLPCLRFSRLYDDADTLREAYRKFVGTQPGRVDPSLGFARGLKLYLETLDGKNVIEEFKALGAHQENAMWTGDLSQLIPSCVAAINSTTRMRYANEKSKAAKEVARAAEILVRFEEGVQLPLLYRAYHHTNVLALADAKCKIDANLIQEARDFFVHHIDKGYLCFREVGVVDSFLEG